MSRKSAVKKPPEKATHLRPLGTSQDATFGKASPYVVKYDESYEAEKVADRTRAVSLAAIEKPWLRIVRCSKGKRFGDQKAHLYPHSKTHVGYTGVGRKLRARLLEVEGVKLWQNGDDEFSVIFPIALVPSVAQIVGPRRKRRSPTASGPTV